MDSSDSFDDSYGFGDDAFTESPGKIRKNIYARVGLLFLLALSVLAIWTFHQPVQLTGKLALMEGDKLTLRELGSNGSSQLSSILTGSQVHFSPDGQKLVFREEIMKSGIYRGSRTVVYDIGRKRRYVFRNVGEWRWLDQDRIWLPDNGEYYINDKKVTDPKVAVIESIVFNVSTNESEKLVSDLKGDDEVYRPEEPLAPINNGDMVVQIAENEGHIVYVGREGQWRRWLSHKDGQGMVRAFWIGEDLIGWQAYDRGGPIDIYDRKTLQRVRRIPIPEPLGYIKSVDVSPNNRKLLLVGERGQGPLATFAYIAQVDTGKLRLVFDVGRIEQDGMWGGIRGPQFWADPAWLPDNRHFLTVLPTFWGGALWLVDSDSPRPLKRKMTRSLLWLSIQGAAWTPM